MIKHGIELGGRTLADMCGYGIELKVGCTLLSVTLRSAKFKSRPLQLPCLSFCALKLAKINFKAIRNLTTACAQVRFSVGLLAFCSFIKEMDMIMMCLDQGKLLI
jgi:hypothetical protein